MSHRRPLIALLVLFVVSAGLHAHRAANPTSSYQSADERSYGKLAVDIADQAHYGSPSTGMKDPLHWPPGAPFLFAVGHQIAPDPDSRESYDIPAAYVMQALVSLGTMLAAFVSPSKALPTSTATMLRISSSICCVARSRLSGMPAGRPFGFGDGQPTFQVGFPGPRDVTTGAGGAGFHPSNHGGA